VVPSGHGTFQGIDLPALDPADERGLTILLEAQHPEFSVALRRRETVIAGGEQVNPVLHIAMHQVVANQLLADDPPETWQAVQRLRRLGYDWHNVMHMIAGVVSDQVYLAVKEHQPFEAGDYARRLSELPGDWPPPEVLGSS
jgi:hypothetical protein